jgi:hypothetical protein
VEENISHARRVQNQWDRERRDKWRAKSRAFSLFSLTSRGLSTKNSSWKAKQLILHTTVTFYGDCMKMFKDFASTFGDRSTGCSITTTHCLTLPFSPGILFLPKTTWLSSPNHLTFLCFSNVR